MQTESAVMSEFTPVNLGDLYGSDSDEEIERPCYSPLSSMSSVDEDILSSEDDNTNDHSSGEEDDNDIEERKAMVTFCSTFIQNCTLH